MAQARPTGWRAGLRRVGCPVMLGAAGFVSYRVAAWIGAHTLGWLGWVALPFLFLPVSVLFTAVVLVIAGKGSAPLWIEARRRVGQLQIGADMDAVRADLKDRAEDQRGWVVLLRGVRAKGRQHMRLRLDLRTDIAPPVGEVSGVRGPRIDTVVNPPDDLARWERMSRPLAGSVVADLATLLREADLGALPLDRKGRDTGWSGLIVQVTATGNEWTFAARSLDDAPIAGELVAAAMAALGWDPSGSPIA